MTHLDRPGFSESSITVGSLEVPILDSRPEGAPDEPTHVLVHGLGVSSLYYRELADELAPDGRVVAMDLPGYGKADKPIRALHMGQYASVVADVIKAIGPTDPVLIGHSMGCQVVVETMARNPGIASSAVLIGPVVNIDERKLGVLLRRFIQSVLGETPRSILPSLVAWIRTGPRMLFNTIPPMLDYRLEESIADVDVPIVLVAGEKDRLAPRSWLEELANATGGDARVEIIADAAHQVMVTHPGLVREAIREAARKGDT